MAQKKADHAWDARFRILSVASLEYDEKEFTTASNIEVGYE